LCKPNNGRTLYLLDEPTTGLHFDDIAKLLKVLGSLVEQGNTVVVIEHNLDVIKTADWIIDVGPEAGAGGGWIVAEGTPEDVVAQAERYRANGDSSLRTVQNDQSWRNDESWRSWTGELLKPVLAREERGELDLFNVADVARKRQGDVEISKVGQEVAAPWQTDGRKWHTQSRISRNGKPCRWEGEALEYVVDRLAEHDGLKEANWNDQASVEITARKKTGTGWFFHALTGDEWLLRMCFRVPKGTFNEADLRSRLRLASVNDLDELPIYNRSERVRINQKKGPFQEVVLDVHWKEEIDTDAFGSFLEEAVRAYLGQVEKSQLSPADLMPWKVLGRKWHLTRKGFPSDKRVAWKLETLETLLDLLDAVFSGLEPDWSNKTMVTYRDPESKETVVELQTKRRDGIYLSLLSEPGRFALGQVASLGKAREIIPHRSGKEAIKIQFTTASQIRTPKLRTFLEEFVLP
jgi:excinuclease ABC subunit A